MKQNIRENKKRIIFWGILAFITIAFSISGAILYSNGHGTVGSIRVKLIPLAKSFNTLDAVIRNGHMKAECNGKEIVVTYKDDFDKINQKFVYSFKNDDNLDYITNTYSDANKKYGDLIATNMIDAIYKTNQGKGKVSDKYRIESFSATSIKDGAEYISKEEIITVNLNIKTNIIVNAVALNIETIQDSDYIHVDELDDMMDSLQRNRTFRIEKKDTIAYVKEDAIYYELFFQYKDKEIMERSAASFINILSPELYTMLDDGTGHLDFTITSSTNTFKIMENVTFIETGIFKSNNNIYEIVIFK